MGIRASIKKVFKKKTKENQENQEDKKENSISKFFSIKEKPMKRIPKTMSKEEEKERFKKVYGVDKK